MPPAFSMKRCTLDLARRFANLKRPNLLLHDTERLVRLLPIPRCLFSSSLREKLILTDLPGQRLIKQWKDFIKAPRSTGRVVFLNDYDMMLAQELSRGSIFGSTRLGVHGRPAGPAA